MAPFEFVEPPTLHEAVHALDPGDSSVRAAGGCTALMLMMKAGVLKPSRLVSLRRIEPRYFAIESDAAEVRVGAQVTLSTLERSSLVQRELPVIVRTLRTLANVRVRNVATLGGHLAHADPHMDLPPVLIALGAMVVVVGRGGERTLPVEELISGYYETTLADDELIAEVRIPHQGARGACYAKVTTRSADDWPALGVAAIADAAKGSVRSAAVVISAATDRPTRLRSVEALLRGARIDAPLLCQIGDAAATEAEPIADARGSAAYKRQLIRVHVVRAVKQALAFGAEGTPP